MMTDDHAGLVRDDVVTDLHVRRAPPLRCLGVGVAVALLVQQAAVERAFSMRRCLWGALGRSLTSG